MSVQVNEVGTQHRHGTEGAGKLTAISLAWTLYTSWTPEATFPSPLPNISPAVSLWNSPSPRENVAVRSESRLFSVDPLPEALPRDLGSPLLEPHALFLLPNCKRNPPSITSSWISHTCPHLQHRKVIYYFCSISPSAVVSCAVE